MCLKLREMFIPQLIDQGLMDLYENLYHDLTSIITETEIRGFLTDRAYLDNLNVGLQKDVDTLMTTLRAITGKIQYTRRISIRRKRRDY